MFSQIDRIRWSQSPLHKAVRHGGTSEVVRAIGCGASVQARDAEGRTPLHYAAMRHAAAIPILLQVGADVNARDKNGWTPLHYGAAFGCSDAVRLLLEAGADPNARDEDGRTPLDLAPVWKQGRDKVVAVLEAHLRARLHEAQQSEFDALVEMGR